ncbi:PP2C family protein-serine/threonine phosphatase [Actinokineospora sp. G85]|uniref:PP2C family protein-serine/threonine phosphatase n=1 Tax=Actinokineospora sp. G85 TaxID=3406626 RepID=UPI003C7349F3
MIIGALGSATGKRYQENYDVAHLGADIAVVADGMGAGPGSEMAGRTAVDLVVAAARTPDAVVAAVAVAHERLIAFGDEHEVLAGCTLTAVFEAGDALWVAHIGDSRLYRLRGELLELLTVDHTMAWLGAVHGWYPFESREAKRARYHLTRCVGDPRRPTPDLLRLDTAPGDVLLLCTDGVAEQVDYHRIARTLAGSPQAAVADLLAAADAAGGNDNATAVVLRF